MTTKTETVTFESVVQSGQFVILDTETTGLDERAEICEIAIISSNGQTLLNTRVRPMACIPPVVTKIHGISDEDVKYSPTWAQVRPDVIDALRGQHLIIYNAPYDMRLMAQSSRAAGLQPAPRAHVDVWDAMLAYSDRYGEWSSYHGNKKWVKLTQAAQALKINVKDAHTALGDCLMTLGVVRHLFT
jgi:DNA polymerase-3 subunit epsilon